MQEVPFQTDSNSVLHFMYPEFNAHFPFNVSLLRRIISVDKHGPVEIMQFILVS